MKINRLIEMTIILLNRKTITAQELAERFGVSTRTIYRDIDVLSSSGVPVFCSQGANGGISVIEDYTINRASLSQKESENIIFALQSMKAAKYPEIDSILDKMGALFSSSQSDWISIDFSSWGANPNEYNKFEIIKNAIISGKIIEIDYINAYNQKSHRSLAPMRLIYKSNSWYLWAFCYNKKDYRLFRITRIKNTELTDESFERRALLDLVENRSEKNTTEYMNIHLVMRFSENVLTRLYDDFDESFVTNNNDGTYTVEVDWPEDEWVYGYILSFGANVEIVSPPHIREIIRERAERIINVYNH